MPNRAAITSVSLVFPPVLLILASSRLACLFIEMPIGKRRKLKKWIDDFETDGKNRIESLLTSISSELKRGECSPKDI